MNIKKDIDFLVIVGPTASGKTELSIQIAKQYNGEIINGDSVQVYRELNIGSAKIKEEEKEGIPHHLINIKDPNEEYTVHDFQKDCNQKIEEIKKRGHLPIIVGGTGLYISSVIYDYSIIKTKIDQDLKESINLLSNEELYDIVKDAAQKYNIEIHVNNRQRLINYAYKVKTNQPLKEQLKMKNCEVLCLNMPRHILYDRINKRVDIMLKDGLVEEVKQFDRTFPSQTAIGYKEVHMYLAGEISEEVMIEKIKQHTRNFAKKQLTWFKNQMDIKMIEVYNDTIKTNT